MDFSTGPTVSADDAQFGVAACPRPANDVSLIGIRCNFRRCLRIALAPPTFALKFGDGVVDLGIGPVVKLVDDILRSSSTRVASALFDMPRNS